MCANNLRATERRATWTAIEYVGCPRPSCWTVGPPSWNRVRWERVWPNSSFWWTSTGLDRIQTQPGPIRDVHCSTCIVLHAATAITSLAGAWWRRHSTCIDPVGPLSTTHFLPPNMEAWCVSCSFLVTPGLAQWIMSASFLIRSMATYETYLLALGDAMFGLDHIALHDGTDVVKIQSCNCRPP
jgi:hypothetical protein